MLDLDNHIFYFVRHPAYGGGNHVANIVSLDPMFSTRWNVPRDQYLAELIKIYNRSIPWAHIPDETAIGTGQWLEQSFIDTQSQCSVHRTHAATYAWEKASIDKLKNKRYILLTFNDPVSADLLIRREYPQRQTSIPQSRYYRSELAFFYDQPIEEPGVDSAETNLKIEVTDIFRSDPESWIQRINQHFGLAIPIDSAKLLHQLWINKNSIKEAP